MEIVSMPTGAGIFTSGAVAGFFLRHTFEPDRTPENTPRQAICECTHSLACHSPTEKRCTATIEVDKYNSATGHKHGKEWRGCACCQYVGPPPPEEYFILGVNE